MVKTRRTKFATFIMPLSAICILSLSGCNTAKIKSVDECLSAFSYERKLQKDGTFKNKLESDFFDAICPTSDGYKWNAGVGYSSPRYNISDFGKEMVIVTIWTNTPQWRHWDRAADSRFGTKFEFNSISKTVDSKAWVDEFFGLSFSKEDALKIANSFEDDDHGPWVITIAAEEWGEEQIGINANYLKAYLIKTGAKSRDS